MKHNTGVSGIRVKSNPSFLVLFLLLTWCVQIVPGLGNTYVQYVYSATARVLSSFSRPAPFAIGDLSVVLSTAGLLLHPAYTRRTRKQRWKSILLVDAKHLLWVYAWFYLAWGLSHLQEDFYERTYIPYIAYAPENFQKFVDSYIKDLNGSYTDITSINGTLVCYESVRACNQISDPLGVHRPFHQSPRVKTTLSTPLIPIVSVTGSMGSFFCEFTLNGNLLPSQYPATYAHEFAHLSGIASEAEINFYVYQVYIRSQVKEIRFSGYFSIPSHVLGNARRLMNGEEYVQLLQRIRSEIIGLAQTNSGYWMKKYNPIIGSTQNQIYDLYPKGDKIESGRESYPEVVGPLISYEEWKKDHIFAPVINQQ